MSAKVMNKSDAANWPLLKRAMHWAIAVAVTIALVAPKPEDGDGLVHIVAGSTAAALALARLCWRLAGDVRPYFRDAVRLRLPKWDLGARGVAPTLMQIGRLLGLSFLVGVPVAMALGATGVGQGEEGPLLEAHEAVGSIILYLAIAHAACLVGFAVLMNYDLVSVTLLGGVRKFAEGGARGLVGVTVGAALAAVALGYAWGPYDLAGKAAAMQEREGGAHGEDDRD